MGRFGDSGLIQPEDKNGKAGEHMIQDLEFGIRSSPSRDCHESPQAKPPF